MRVLFLDTKANNPNRYIARAVFAALKRHPAVREARWATYADALTLAQESRFDLLLAFDGEEADNAILERLCARVGQSAIWFTEDPYEVGRNRVVAPWFDLVATNDRASAGAYGAGALHLALAADRDARLPLWSDAPAYDLFFAGTAWPNRLETLDAVRQRRPDLRTKLVLVSNPAIAPAIARYRDRFAFSPGVSIRDFGRIANRSLLTLALPRRFSSDPGNPEAASDTPGPRLFEVAIAGGAQLVDAGTTPEAARLLEPGTEFLSFDSLDELLARIDEARADPARVRAIAAAAQARCLAEHTCDHRVATLLDALPAARARPVAPARKSRALFVAHHLTRYGTFGGAELTLDALTEHLGTVEPFVLAPDRRAGAKRNAFALFGPDGELRETFALPKPIGEGDLVNEGFDRAFQGLLDRHGFDLVHVNHLRGLSFSVPQIAKAYGARVVVAVHDYFAACENYNLIGFEDRYCDILHRPAQTCDACLRRTRGRGEGSQARRRRFFAESLRSADVLLAGSEASAAILAGIYPHLKDRFAIVPPPLPRIPERRTRPADDVLHVALLGNFTAVKGAATALQVFEATRGMALRFHVFGRVDFDVAERLKGEAFAHVEVHGGFPPGELPAGLDRCRLALILSPWPETYCISLSEVQATGLVPVVTALGAQGERVRDGIDGFHVPVNDAEAVAAVLRRAIAEPALIEAMAARLPAAPGQDGPAYAAAVDALYARLLDGRTPFAEGRRVRRALDLSELEIYLASPRWAKPASEAPVALAGAGGHGLLGRQAARLARGQELWRRFVYLKETEGLQAAVNRGVYWLNHWRARRR
ncbi:MAG TPA: glycosyltransferase [Beijerinckiaceae bacterium]|jgi:glycosyltransferase involved in cell wall biosynthesis